jgi:hypothetical protein
VFNPKPPDKTKVLSHVIVVNTEVADTLLEMSVLGKIGLTANPYKGRVKYYVNWKEPNARKAYLKCTFSVDRPSSAFAASSLGQVIEVVNAASAVQLPLSLDSPRNGFATTSTQFRLRAHRSQLTLELTSLMYRSKQALTVSEPAQPRAADPSGHLKPLNAHLVDIFSMPAAQEEGLVVVKLFSGISATVEALLRAGVKIKKLYCCEIDPKAQAVTKWRASNWLQVFPELLQPAALEGFPLILATERGVDWKFTCFSHGEARLNCCTLSMPGVLSRVRTGTRPSRPKNSPAYGGAARHPLDSSALWALWMAH